MSRHFDAKLDIEASIVELEAAISLIQHLLPDEIPQTRDQEALAGIGYIIVTMRMYIKQVDAALERLFAASRTTQDDGAALH